MKRISVFRELTLLTKQYFRIMFGDVKNLIVTLVFPVIAAFITVWIAGENMFVTYEGTKSACFVLVSAAIWGGLFNSIQIIVRERANIKRDMVSGGLRLSCYMLSRAIPQLLLCALQSAVLCVSLLGVEWKYDNLMPESGVIFSSPLVEYYISLFLLTFSADAMGILISCIVKKEETANVMAPYILIVQLIFSGILFEMKGAAEKLSYAMLSRWGMVTMGSISNLNDLPLTIQLTVPQVEHNIEDMFTYTAEHLAGGWAVLAAFAIGFIVLGNVMLYRVRKDGR